MFIENNTIITILDRKAATVDTKRKALLLYCLGQCGSWNPIWLRGIILHIALK
jgi:hypothetical protein